MGLISMIKPLSREELKKRYDEIILEHGKPKSGIASFEHLISKILITFSNYHKAYIIYQNNEFKILSPPDVIWTVQFNYIFVGYVTAKEWGTYETFI